MILHFNTCWHPPTLAVYQAEHIAEAVEHQSLILFPRVTSSDNALADHIVSVVGMDALFRVLELTRKVYVIHRNLRQTECASMTVHVRHLLVHKRGVALVRLGDK